MTVFFSILLCILFSGISPGADYDEAQRSVYNKWIFESLAESKHPSNFFMENVSPCFRDGIKRIKEITEWEKPDLCIDFKRKIDVLSLPLEGLTEEELMNLAESGNAEACMLLSAMSKGKNSLFMSFHEMKKWMNLAVMRGRPGADFLLKIIHEQERQLPGFVDVDISQLPGYSDFCLLIDAGDYDLFKSFVYLNESADLNEILCNRLIGALGEKSKKGDLKAERNLAELRLELRTDIIHFTKGVIDSKIRDEILASDNARLQWLPNKLRNRLKTKVKVSASKSPTWNRQLQAAHSSKKLADMGDVSSMYTWLKSGTMYYENYDRETWQSILHYSNLLLEIGHAEQLIDFRTSCYFNDVCFWMPQSILLNYYSKKSVENTYANVNRILLDRGCVTLLAENITEEITDREQNDFVDSGILVSKIKRINRIAPQFLMQPCVYPLILEKAKDSNLRKEVFSLIEEAARTGCPEAELALACMINHEVVSPKNPEKSCSLLEQAWVKCKKYNSLAVLLQYDDEEEDYLYSYRTLACLVVKELMDLYLSKDLAIRNPAKAATLAQEYYAMAKEDKLEKNLADYNSPSSCYYMGMIHENGYGVPIDQGKAILYYKEGAEKKDEKSISALDKLQQKPE